MTVEEEIKALEARVSFLKDAQRKEALEQAKVLLEKYSTNEVLLSAIVEIANEHLYKIYRDEDEE